MNQPDVDRLVADWIERRQPGAAVVVGAVVHDLRPMGASAPDIVRAIADQATHGRLVRAIAVRTPDGLILEKAYLTEIEIEPLLEGRLGRVYSRDDAEIIPAFRVELLRGRGRNASP